MCIKMASGDHKAGGLGVRDLNGPNPAKTQRGVRDEQRKGRAGPGRAREFPREGQPSRVSGWFSLLKAHRLEPALGSWPGRDLISARLATASREHNTRSKGMPRGPVWEGAGWRGVERCRPGAPVQGRGGLGRGSCNLAIGPAARPSAFAKAAHPRPPGRRRLPNCLPVYTACISTTPSRLARSGSTGAPTRTRASVRLVHTAISSRVDMSG